MRGGLGRARRVCAVLLPATLLALPLRGAERELDEDTPPSSVLEIETPIQRVFPEEVERPPLVPGIRRRLQNLPAFFADTHLEARFRTYYLRQDRAIGPLSEAWAIGGSISYRSGWLADLFQAEVEGFTSQPLVAPEGRGGTLLLQPVQDGIGVLGIANGRLRYRGLVLTGYRQYLDLPYVNRQDNRMIPNTFEAITLAKPEGQIRFSTGYAWRIKTRDSDRFRSFTGALNLPKDRGFAHAGAVWEPHEDFSVGAIGGLVPDLFAGFYAELDYERELADGVEGRLDGQFTYQGDIGKDLSGPLFDETWNLGLRASTSYAGAVFRLGFSITGSGGANVSPFGTNPSYINLMQRAFVAANEKALLASISYDFSGLGVQGLSAILNFAAGFDGERFGVRSDSREIDLTLDYKLEQGWLESFWLRVRGSWLGDDEANRDGTDVRVILRYDFPVI